MTGDLPRAARVATLIATLALVTTIFLSPAAVQATPLAQGQPTTEEDRWRRAEEIERSLADELSAWPAAYPLPGTRWRPAYPGDSYQRPYPWELPGSPYLPVPQLREMGFMGIQPGPADPCYGRILRSYQTPVAFRLNYLEAARYLSLASADYSTTVLNAWEAYLTRGATPPGRVQAPDDAVAMVGGCRPLPPLGADATLPPTAPGELAPDCHDLQRPVGRWYLSPQEVTDVVGGWLRQCGYLAEIRFLPAR